jgi:hypothetical protein
VFLPPRFLDFERFELAAYSQKNVLLHGCTAMKDEYNSGRDIQQFARSHFVALNELRFLSPMADAIACALQR